MSSILPTLGKDVSIDIGSIQTRLMGGARGTVDKRTIDYSN